MKRIYLEWTNDELDFLREHYPTASQEFLRKNLRNRNWVAITKKAMVIGVQKETTRKSDISILLHDNPISYYWVGFLLADGGFTDRRVSVGMSNKDIDHLIKFKKFINSDNSIKNRGNYNILKVTSVNEVRALREKFGITNRKTYEPCNIQKIEDKDLLFSLIIGFIDGDGSVSKNEHNGHILYVVGHSSWINNFIFMKSFIYDLFNEEKNYKIPQVKKRFTTLPQDKDKIKKQYYAASFYISRYKILQAMKDKADELGLPYLRRKLGQIEKPKTGRLSK